MPAPRGAAGVRPAEAASPRTDVLARVGDPIEVGFDGRGWLYLGCGEEQGGAGEGLVFHGGTTSGGRSLFSFGALERGVYDLRFQLQDNVNGGLREETVRVSVLSEGEFAERLASAPAAETPSAGAGRSVGDPRRSAAAERYFSLGEYDRAIPEFLAVYEEGGPHLDERLADSYAATGDYPAAARYYVRNLSASEPYASRAAAGLARAAATTGDAALLLEQFPGVQGPEPMPVGEALLAVGRSQAEAGRPAVAVAVLREYLRGDFSGGRLDEACFLLAQLLEADTPLRDLRQARDLYHRVWDEFPESPLAAPAKARRDYLNRHFFLVR